MPIRGAKSSSTKTVMRPDGSNVVKTKVDYGYKVVKNKITTRADGTVVTKQDVEYPERKEN